MLAMRTALTAFRRSPLLSVLSVTTIAFSLFAFGLFGLVALNIRNALQRVEERVEIRAFVAEGTPVETIAAASDEVAKYPQVLKVDVAYPMQDPYAPSVGFNQRKTDTLFALDQARAMLRS